MERKKPVILIVDNEVEICRLFRDFFDFMGYQSLIEADGEKALRELETYSYDLLFVDLKLDTVSGVDILKRSKKIHPDAEVVVVTGYGSEETVMRTLLHGAFSYLQKPISFSEIKIQTEQALAKQRFNSKTRELLSTLEAEHPEMVSHLDTILSLDRFSSFVSFSIDINTLADSILSGVSEILPGYCYSFLVFDEIDTGIGGRVAERVGARLKALAAGSQVVCVTHLPQVAAFADRHLRVSKHGAGDAVRTVVKPLSKQDRIDELARMISGAEITEQAKSHAKALIGRAEGK